MLKQLDNVKYHIRFVSQHCLANNSLDMMSRPTNINKCRVTTNFILNIIQKSKSKRNFCLKIFPGIT